MNKIQTFIIHRLNKDITEFDNTLTNECIGTDVDKDDCMSRWFP